MNVETSQSCSNFVTLLECCIIKGISLLFTSLQNRLRVEKDRSILIIIGLQIVHYFCHYIIKCYFYDCSQSYPGYQVLVLLSLIFFFRWRCIRFLYHPNWQTDGRTTPVPWMVEIYDPVGELPHRRVLRDRSIWNEREKALTNEAKKSQFEATCCH